MRVVRGARRRRSELYATKVDERKPRRPRPPEPAALNHPHPMSAAGMDRGRGRPPACPGKGPIALITWHLRWWHHISEQIISEYGDHIREYRTYPHRRPHPTHWTVWGQCRTGTHGPLPARFASAVPRYGVRSPSRQTAGRPRLLSTRHASWSSMARGGDLTSYVPRGRVGCVHSGPQAT